MTESEGYHALLQLLRARTPADLLRASSRLCSHVVGSEGAATVVPAPTPLVGSGPLSVSRGEVAEKLLSECNELLLSNGREVDLSALLSSPDKLLLPQLSAKRQKTHHNPASWRLSSASAGPPVDAGPAADAVQFADSMALEPDDLLMSAPTAGPPSLDRKESHLKRPQGLALFDLQVPAQPAAIPFGSGSLPANGGTAGMGGALDEVGEIPLPDVQSILSPLLASSLGIAENTMRSFLRLDDLTFDLLSPLGTGRPPPGEQGEDKFINELPPTE